ncbi:MAG: GNAT family N-acetyltransferase [Paracoccaceae bacterium]
MTQRKLRDATYDDLDRMQACIKAAYAPALARLSDLPDVAGGLEQDLKNNIVRVVVVGDRLVAVMVLVLHRDHVKLANIAVHPDHGGAGHGRALLQEATAIARQLDRCELRLVTHVGMPENVALYTHMGWKKSGQRGNAILMRLAV